MKQFGLVGHPLGHSFSKAYFTEKFEREGLDCEYLNFDIDDLSSIRNIITEHPDLKGLNVTVPYKEAIISHLDELDSVANEIKAVNTVKVLPDGRLKGFNTDIIGLEKTLSMAMAGSTSMLGTKSDIISIESALILGTGGASKAVQYVLTKHYIPFHLVSRNPEKGDFTYQNLTPEIITSHPLIINATPVGMAPHIDEASDLPYDAITPQHILFDLIYNPKETRFLQHGRDKGARTLNGLTMLHAQAEAAWRIWNE